MLRHSASQDHHLEKSLDALLLPRLKPAIEQGRPVHIVSPICNVNRTVGTMIAHAIVSQYGERGLAADTVTLEFSGTAGQSLALLQFKV